MTDFETQVKAAAEKAVLHHVSSGQWLLPNYESRLKVPAEWMTEMWRLVDADRVRRQVAERIEADRGLGGTPRLPASAWYPSHKLEIKKRS